MTSEAQIRTFGREIGAPLGAFQPWQSWLEGLPRVDWQDLAWSLGVVVAAGIVGRLVAALVTRSIGRWARHTDTIVDDAIAQHLRRPIRWVLPLLSVQLALPMLAATERVRAALEHSVLILLIVGFGWGVIKAVHVLEQVVVQRFDVTAADNLRARQVQTQFRGFRNIAIFVITVVTVAFILLTFEPVRQLGAGLLASAGVAGIVIGFAAQRSLGTILAGIQIALSQPIRVDDVVIVEGEWGKIEEITLTYVVVRIWDLRRLVVPITYFIEKPFQNWTRVSADILGTVSLHLDYNVDVERLREELKRLLDGSELWDGVAWGMQVTDASERTMTVRALMSSRNAGDAWDLRCHVREKLIAFVRHHDPDALPRFRAAVETSSSGSPQGPRSHQRDGSRAGGAAPVGPADRITRQSATGGENAR